MIQLAKPRVTFSIDFVIDWFVFALLWHPQLNNQKDVFCWHIQEDLVRISVTMDY